MKSRQQLLKQGFFARHETFCPRYGWLKKGFDGVQADGKIFERPDAIERLGVGKNMVRSIRFWCLVFKLIRPVEESSNFRISGPMRTSRFAQRLLAKNGWDPFLEDPASLWLLHWRLFIPPVIAPAWAIALNLNALGMFTQKDLARALIASKETVPEFDRFSDSSFQKDASCFIRMYGPPDPDVREIESPFTHLELLSAEYGNGHFRFNLGEKPDLPDSVFLAACLDYAHYFHNGLKNLSLNQILYGFNSPGVVFKLTETDVGHRLERITARISGIEFTEAYGNWQLQFEKSPEILSDRILSRYYQKTSTGLIK